MSMPHLHPRAHACPLVFSQRVPAPAGFRSSADDISPSCPQSSGVFDMPGEYTYHCTHQKWGRKLTADCGNIVPRTPTARSRVTNGNAVLPGIDGRSTWARRLRDLIDLHISDLGGPMAVSEAERSIVRRAATMTVELERLESQFAVNGEASARELDLYQRTAGNLRRLLEAVGTSRRQRNITPDPLSYAAAKAAEKAA